MSTLAAWGLGGTMAGLSVVLQTWPRWRNRWFGVDTWRHLAAADHIRRTGRVFDMMREHYVIEEPSDYPPMLRLLLAALPKATAERFQWLVSPAIDAVHNLLLFAVLYGMTGLPWLAAAAQLCYSANPFIVMENASLMNRALSTLAFSLSFVPFILYLETSGWAWGMAAILGLALLYLTHRTAIQAMVVLVVTVACWRGSWMPLGYLLFGALGALLLSGGRYARIAAGHLEMLRCWRRNIRDRFAHQVRGESPQRAGGRDMILRVYQWLRRAPAAAVLGAHPVLALSLAVYLVGSRTRAWEGCGLPEAWLRWCAVWAGGLWTAAVFIRQVPAIRFLGEGERYLAYANAPGSALGAALLCAWWRQPAWHWALWVFLAVVVAGGLLPAIALQRLVVLHDTERSVTPALRRLFATLNAIPGEVRLLTMPTYLADAAMYFTKSRVVSTDNSRAHNTAYAGLWPRLTRPLSEFIRRFQVNYVLVNEKFATLPELALSESSVVQRADNYCLLHV